MDFKGENVNCRKQHEKHTLCYKMIQLIESHGCAFDSVLLLRHEDQKLQ